MARARTTLPRLAVNATLAGFWAAALLTLLVFYVNSSVSLTLRNFLPLAVVIMGIYGPISGVVWSLLAGAVRLFVAFRVRIPWVGFRPFWRFLVANLFLLTLLYAHNLRVTRDYLPEAMRAHLTSATLLLGAGTALLAADVLRRGFGRRRQRPWAALLAALLLTGGLFGIRERYRDVKQPPSASEIEVVPPSSAIVLLGIDGASPDDLFGLVAEGRLPVMAELARHGASAALESTAPPRPQAAWSSVLTGREPAAHGVVDARLFTPPWRRPVFRVAPARVGLSWLSPLGALRFDLRPAPSPAIPTADRILARCGYRAVVSGWQGLLPGEVGGVAAVSAALPAELDAPLRALRAHERTARDHPDGEPLTGALDRALRRDLAVMTTVLAGLDDVDDSSPPAVLARLDGLDGVARVFMRYRRPDAFGNVRRGDVELFGTVLPDYYRFIDAWLGVLAERLGPDTTVIVTSPYAVEPVELGHRIRNALTGAGHVSGSHREAEPGVFLIGGPGIRPGGRLERVQAVDVLPTLLYLRDLPVGRDMEGEPLDRVASDSFAEVHALAAVPSWETVTIVGPPI